MSMVGRICFKPGAVTVRQHDYKKDDQLTTHSPTMPYKMEIVS